MAAIKVKVYNMAGEEAGEVKLSEALFGADINSAALHAVVRAQLLNRRQGTQSTKTRAEVRGGGAKPWRQKGTGRARQGSRRNPQWTHGGIALGPKPRSYRVQLNKKLRRTALISALSAKAASKEILVVDGLAAKEYKTRPMVEMLAKLNAEKKVLVVLPEMDDKLIRSFANIPGVKTTQANNINVYDILNCDNLLFAKSAVAIVEEVYKA